MDVQLIYLLLLVDILLRLYEIVFNKRTFVNHVNFHCLKQETSPASSEEQQTWSCTESQRY